MISFKQLFSNFPDCRIRLTVPSFFENSIMSIMRIIPRYVGTATRDCPYSTNDQPFPTSDSRETEKEEENHPAFQTITALSIATNGFPFSCMIILFPPHGIPRGCNMPTRLRVVHFSHMRFAAWGTKINAGFLKPSTEVLTSPRQCCSSPSVSPSCS